MSRPLEAVALYREGFAGQILMSPGGRDASEIELERIGIHVPNEVETARDILVTHMGIPATAVTILATDVDNTAQEAEHVKAYLAAHDWTRVIILTDCSSTRRAGYAFQRELGPAVTVITRCPRSDRFDGRWWWTSRGTFRAVFYEAPKLLAYWLGLRG